MEYSWLLLIITTLCISFFLKKSNNQNNKKKKKLPPGPGPFDFSVIGSLLWGVELILRDLKAKYGPLFNLRSGIISRSSIFVASHSLAYRALVQQGAVFSDRPKAAQTSVIIHSNRINISSAPYGPLWRLLRRNLTSAILHPSRTKSFSKARSQALSVLVQQLHSDSDSATENLIRLIVHFHYATIYLLVLVCFGDKIDETQVKRSKDVQRRWIVSVGRFINLSFLPRYLEKIIFRNRWKELIQLQLEQERIFIPLIEARMKAKSTNGLNHHEEEEVMAYVDTLLNLELPEKKRKINHGEIVGLCSEFLTAGTDTTSTSLQWII
ncbi:cytochrome p450 89a2 [Nicotiana attenuata]|uniref:Cytochrome p450 89a2 n=1 Tax=Nicotiana attenuata TaxID=49451 RepID=A0A314LFI7_NICAT|nr:cytochrome p450 89a2 [Nicotiana attenuata]